MDLWLKFSFYQVEQDGSVFIKNIFQKAGVLDSGQKAIALSTYVNLTNVVL